MPRKEKNNEILELDMNFRPHYSGPVDPSDAAPWSISLKPADAVFSGADGADLTGYAYRASKSEIQLGLGVAGAGLAIAGPFVVAPWAVPVAVLGGLMAGVSSGLSYANEKYFADPKAPSCEFSLQQLEKLFSNFPPVQVGYPDHIALDEKQYQTLMGILDKFGASQAEAQKIIFEMSQQQGEQLKNFGVQLHRIEVYLKEQEQKSATEQDYQYYQEFLLSFSALAAATHSPELQKWIHLSSSVLRGVQIVASIGAGISVGLVTGIVGAAVGVVAGVLPLLFSGVNPTQFIADQITELSHKISRFQERSEELMQQQIQLEMRILETVQWSLSIVVSHIREYTGAARLEMRATLQRIEEKLRDLSLQTHLGHVQLFMKTWLELRDSIQNWCQRRFDQDVERGMIYYSNQLTTWAVTHSVNSLLNGAIWREFASTETQKFLCLKADPAENANDMIGYFNPDCVHPELWLQNISLYVSLYSQFWMFALDEPNMQKMQKSGQQVLDFCEKNQDGYEFSKILHQYYVVLKQVERLIAQYSKLRSETWLREYDAAYLRLMSNKKAQADTESTPQPLLRPGFVGFNFLSDDTAVLIQAFDKCGIFDAQLQLALFTQPRFFDVDQNKFVDEIEEVEGWYSNFRYKLRNLHLDPLSKLDSQRILQKFSSKEVACAYYLQVMHNFELRQKDSLTGIDKKVRDNRLLLSTKPDLGMATPSWTLNFTLHTTTTQGENKHLCDLHFQQRWSDCRERLESSWSDERKKDDDGVWNEGGVRYPSLRLLDENDNISPDLLRFLNAYVKLVVQVFNSRVPIVQRVTMSGQTSEIEDLFKLLIRNKIIEKRRELLRELLMLTVRDDEAAQELLNHLRAKLTELDLLARQLKYRLYYAGLFNTSEEASVLCKKIFDSDCLHKQWQTDLERDFGTDPLRSPDWWSDLQSSSKHEIRVYDIDQLPRCKKLPFNHPQSLVQAGLCMLQLLPFSRRMQQQKYPIFARSLKLATVQMEQERAFNEVAFTEIYGLLTDTYRRDFTLAKGRLTKRSEAALTPQDYKQFFMLFSDWAIVSAALPNLRGDLKSDGFEGIDGDPFFISADKMLGLLTFKLPYGWGHCVSLLFQLACGLDKKNLAIRDNLVNFHMWLEGSDLLLRMLTYEPLAKYRLGLVECADRTEEQRSLAVEEIQLRHIEELIARGCNLLQAIEAVIKSSILENLLEEYLKILGQLLDYKIKNPAQDLSDVVYAGASVSALNVLEALRILILRYLEMTHAYFLNFEPDFVVQLRGLQSKQKLMALLLPTIANRQTGFTAPKLVGRVETAAGSTQQSKAVKATLATHSQSDLQRLQKVFQECQRTQGWSVTRLKQLREMLQFRDALNDLLKPSAKHAKKPSTDHAPSTVRLIRSTLCIESMPCQLQFGMAKLLMLEQFLSHYQGITALRIENDDFSQVESLKTFLRLLQNFPAIEEIALLNCEISVQELQNIGAEFNQLPTLRRLNLANNTLISKDTQRALADLQLLKKVFAELIHIVAFDLTHTGFGLLTFRVLLTYLEQHPTTRMIHMQAFDLPPGFNWRGQQARIIFSPMTAATETVDLGKRPKISGLPNGITAGCRVGPPALHETLDSLRRVQSELFQRVSALKEEERDSPNPHFLSY